MLIVALLVVGVIVLRLLTADERKLAAGRALEFTQQLRAARANIRPCEPLRTNLRERTKRTLAAPAIAGAFALVFAMGSADGLANIGPQTTGGQWWRLLTSAFVQPGVLALIVSLAGFVQPALLLERLVGPVAFVSVFAASAATGAVVQLAINPVGVNYGAAAAICGVYGLLAVVVAFGAIWPSPVTIPFLAIKRMAPGMAIFLLYQIATGAYSAAETIGFITGLGYGVVAAFGIGEGKPPVRRVAAALAATAVITVAVAFSIGSIRDVRPEMASVIALEVRTADAYNAAVEKFRHGRIKTDALVKLIEQTIVPELQAAEKRVTALDSVPKEQQPLVAHAEEYLRLRSESWQLRSEGLKTTNMQRLRQAERTERASLGALEQIRAKSEPAPSPELSNAPTQNPPTQ